MNDSLNYVDVHAMHGCYVAMALDADACYLFATWTYLHGYAFESLGTLEVLSGRGGLDLRVHACWRLYLGWRWMEQLAGYVKACCCWLIRLMSLRLVKHFPI